MLDQIALSEIQLGHLLRLHRSQATFPAQRNHADPQDVETYATPYKIDSLAVRIAALAAELEREFFDETRCLRGHASGTAEDRRCK